MLTDLHIHSYFSDGTLSPEEIVEEAKTKGLELIAVADHNNIDAFARLKVACDKESIKTFTAVELDVMMEQQYLHLLAYGFDIQDSEILSLVTDCSNKMKHGNDSLIRNMAKEHSNIDIEKYENYQYDLKRGGHKHSNFLIDKEIINNHKEIFSLFDKYGIPLEKIGLIELEVACKIIHHAGGYAVLAHPGNTLDKPQFLCTLNEVKKAGIDGLECFYPSHSDETTKLCVNFCKENDLLITAGSDCHGEFKHKMGTIKIDTEDLNLHSIMRGKRIK